MDLPGRYNPFNNDPQDDESAIWCRKHRVEYFEDEGCYKCRAAAEADSGLQSILIDVTRTFT